MTNNISKKIILFDIDYTIWHTDHFRDLLYPQLAKETGYTLEEFFSLAKAIDGKTKEQKGFLHLDTWLTLIHKEAQTNVSKETLQKLLWEETLYTESLEKNIAETLTTLRNRGYELGVFSTGEKSFQQKKLTSIDHLFTQEHVYIFNDKLLAMETILQKYSSDGIIIVDDLPVVLAAAKQFHPTITTILRTSNKRYETTQQQTNFQPDYTIKELQELLTIV